MIRPILFALLAGLIGFGSYQLSYRMGARAPSTEGETAKELAWLRAEFRLSAGQFEKIRALHEAYGPVCEEHCLRVQEKQALLARMRADGRQHSPEYTAALAAWDVLQQTCKEATMQHLQSVAAAMDPDQGRRYLRLVTPHLAGHDHGKPAGLKP